MNIRSVVKWSVTTLFGLVVIPVLSSNVETFAAERKWNRFLTDHWGQVMSSLAELAKNPWYIWAFGVVTGALLTLWGLEFLPKERAGRGGQSNASTPSQLPAPNSEFDSARQRQLTNDLREYASEYARAKVLMADIKHRPLADTLISIFNLAGWQADLTNVPLETYVHKYHEGIEVHGYNAHFVEAVCAALTRAGLPKVRPSLGELTVPRDNPKWPFAQQTVKITIGHR